MGHCDISCQVYMDVCLFLCEEVIGQPVGLSPHRAVGGTSHLAIQVSWLGASTEFPVPASHLPIWTDT